MGIWKALFRHAAEGRVESIFVAEAAGAPMTRVMRTEAVAGQGLRGDRYASDQGYYHGPDACQVTMIDARALARAQRRYGVALSEGEHRRNLVVHGVRLDRATGRRVHVGSAIFVCTGPRPPCGYLERLTQRGMVKALLSHPGVCLETVHDGIILEGDAVWIE